MSASTTNRPSRPAVSAIVTTFNEEQNIAGCIESLLWCDEILVVDSFSTDRTPEIARGYDKVRFSQRTYFGSASQKNWAMDQVKNEWILIYDADERCTPALQKEIEDLLASRPSHAASTSWAASSASPAGSTTGSSAWCAPAPPATRTAACTPT
jgi:glycosyltransferase involved in cell wall biosynthesis